MKARTRHASALLSAVALLATGPPAHARTHATKTCVKPVGAATVHRDRYTVRYRKIIGSAPDLRVFYWACLRATGKRTRLTEATGKNDPAPILNSRFRSSRRFVAYVQTRSRHDTAELHIFAFDLRTGRRAAGISQYGLGLGLAMPGRDGGWSLAAGDLAVSDAGGLAWHEVGQPVPNQDVPAESIKAHDATGTQTPNHRHRRAARTDDHRQHGDVVSRRHATDLPAQDVGSRGHAAKARTSVRRRPKPCVGRAP